VAFANTGDGNGLTHTAAGTVIGDATQAVGPPTAYAGTKPFANIEYSVAHTSTPLQAIAGGGGTHMSDKGFSGIYLSSSYTVNEGSEESPVLRYYWSIRNTGTRTQASVVRSFGDVAVVTQGEGEAAYDAVIGITLSDNGHISKRPYDTSLCPCSCIPYRPVIS
jgi:hypothetical protein